MLYLLCELSKNCYESSYRWASSQSHFIFRAISNVTNMKCGGKTSEHNGPLLDSTPSVYCVEAFVPAQTG